MGDGKDQRHKDQREGNRIPKLSPKAILGESGQTTGDALNPYQLTKCESRELNPDALRHWILSPARLPIPPLSRD
jgi:hypothetical protein